MKLKPDKWTHHHTHRLYHASIFVSLSLIVCLLIAGQLINYFHADALDVGIVAQVGEITPGPSTPIIGGGGVVPIVPVLPDYPLVENIDNKDHQPLVEIISISSSTRYVDNRTKQVYWVVKSSCPTIIGTTSVSEGLVYIEFSGAALIRAQVRSDSAGNWTWQCSSPLPVGNYNITVVVNNPLYLDIFSGQSYLMTITAPDGLSGDVPGDITDDVPTVPIVKIPKPTSDGSDLGASLSLFTFIPKNFKIVRPGSTFEASISLRSRNIKSDIVLPLSYVIYDEANKIILKDEQQISFSKQINFSKTFQTAPNARPGKYWLVVSTPYNDAILMANDYFVLSDPILLVGTTDQSRKFPTAAQALYLLLAVFVIFTYIELHFIVGLSQKIHMMQNLGARSK